MCDYVVIMSFGRVVAIGTVEELVEQFECETLEEVFVRISRDGEEE
jgi:ABC-2 type transport system ATP-binding protein